MNKIIKFLMEFDEGSRGATNINLVGGYVEHVYHKMSKYCLNNNITRASDCTDYWNKQCTSQHTDSYNSGFSTVFSATKVDRKIDEMIWRDANAKMSIEDMS